MTAIILLMLLQENSDAPLFNGGRVGQNRPAVVRQADRPFLNRLARPFRRNR